MELGLNLVRARPDRMPEIAAHAEALGYESVFVPDHLVFPVRFSSKYPGTPDGAFPYARDTPLYDPWVVLAQVAAATTRLKLGTAIYVLPLRHPIVTARLVSTLDALSGGRVVFGVGVGWLREEFEALGIDPRTRGARTEEAATAIRRLWTEAEPSFHGEHFSFDAVYFEPKPVSDPHPPMLFGGESEVALDRAVRLGDGWMSGGAAEGIEQITSTLARLRELRDRHGTDRPFNVTILHPNPRADELEQMAAAGVDRVVVMPWASNRTVLADIEAFAALAATALG